MKRTRATVRKRSWVDHVMNETSVRNALLMFNVMFALQTGLDLAIVSGGAALPEGLSYASYAHRGAYPLVVTALLAGVFAITALSERPCHACLDDRMGGAERSISGIEHAAA